MKRKLSKQQIYDHIKFTIRETYHASLMTHNDKYITLFITPSCRIHEKITKTDTPKPRTKNSRVLAQFQNHYYGPFSDDKNMIETIENAFALDNDILTEFHNNLTQHTDQHIDAMHAYDILQTQHFSDISKLEDKIIDQKMQNFENYFNENFNEAVNKFVNWIYENQERE